MKEREKARSKAAGGQGEARIQDRRHGHGCPGKKGIEWGEEEAAPVEGGEEEELRQDMEGEQGEGEEGEAKVEEEEDIDREQG